MEQYFERINQCSQSNKYPPRIRFMLRDLIELRNNEWVPRKLVNTEGPVPMQQLRTDDDDVIHTPYVNRNQRDQRNNDRDNDSWMSKMQLNYQPNINHHDFGTGGLTGSSNYNSQSYNSPVSGNYNNRDYRDGGNIIMSGGAGGGGGHRHNNNNPRNNQNHMNHNNYNHNRYNKHNNQHNINSHNNYNNNMMMNNKQLPPRFKQNLISPQPPPDTFENFQFRPATNSLLYKGSVNLKSAHLPLLQQPRPASASSTDTIGSAGHLGGHGSSNYTNAHHMNIENHINNFKNMKIHNDIENNKRNNNYNAFNNNNGSNNDNHNIDSGRVYPSASVISTPQPVNNNNINNVINNDLVNNGIDNNDMNNDITNNIDNDIDNDINDNNNNSGSNNNNSILTDITSENVSNTSGSTPVLTSVQQAGNNALNKEQILIKPASAEKLKQNKKDKGPNKEEVLKKVVAFLKDTLINTSSENEQNMNEIVAAFLELKVPDKLMRDVMSTILNEIVDKNELTHERTIEFLAAIKKDGKLQSVAILDGFKTLINGMSDSPVPRIATLVASLLCRAVMAKLCRLADVATYIENGAHYPLFLLILQQLHKTIGKQALTELFNESKVNLMSTLPEADRTKDRMAEILDDRNLSFLYPLLKLQGELQKQIQADSNPQQLYKWIKDNVDAVCFNDSGFIQALINIILKYVTQVISLNLKY